MEMIRMPVRKIPRSHSHVTGRHSAWDGKAIAFESTLERDFITLMLFDQATENLEEQPVKIPVPGQKGRASYYVPDFLVHRKNQAPKLIEVKPSEVLQNNAEKFENRFQAARVYAGTRGWVFEIWTEKEIRIPLLDNAKFLRPYQTRKDIDHGLCARLARQVSEQRQCTVERLTRAPSDEEKLERLTCLWHLIAIGRFSTDLNVPLTSNSVLSYVNGRQNGVK